MPTLSLLIQSIPDTNQYKVMGYTVFFVVMALYFLSLFIRSRNLKKELETLEELDANSSPS